jgi:hypothetical protein
MNKILLVYEDYADLMNVESTLKRVGFDVIGLTNEYTVAEQVLAFNPDLVVGSGRGGKVSSLGVGKRLKEMHRWAGKSVLIFPAAFKPEPQDLIRIRVDMMLEAPVPALRLIQVVGKLLNHDETVLMERLNKSSTASEAAQLKAAASTAVGGKFNLDSESIYIKGRTEDVAKNADERALRSEKISEDSMDFSLNKEESEDRPKVSFKFGDRMSQAESSSRSKSSTEEAPTMFADVDLKALEKELLGGGAPEIDRIDPSETSAPVETDADARAQGLPSFEIPATEKPSTAAAEQATAKDINFVTGNAALPESPAAVLSEAEELQDLQAKAQRELSAAEKSLKKRLERYAEMVADVKVAPKSTVSRVEARRRQKQLAADWDTENINKLDELRREFTKALFKK